MWAARAAVRWGARLCSSRRQTAAQCWARARPPALSRRQAWRTACCRPDIVLACEWSRHTSHSTACTRAGRSPDTVCSVWRRRRRCPAADSDDSRRQAPIDTRSDRQRPETDSASCNASHRGTSRHNDRRATCNGAGRLDRIYSRCASHTRRTWWFARTECRRWSLGWLLWLLLLLLLWLLVLWLVLWLVLLLLW